MDALWSPVSLPTLPESARWLPSSAGRCRHFGPPTRRRDRRRLPRRWHRPASTHWRSQTPPNDIRPSHSASPHWRTPLQTTSSNPASNLERQPLHPILSCDRSTPPFVVKQPSFGRNVAMGLGRTRRRQHSGKDHHSDRKLELVGHPVPGVRRRRMAIVIDSPAGLARSSLPCVGGPFRCYRNKNLTKRANC